MYPDIYGKEWTEEKTVEEALQWMENYHQELRVNAINAEVKGYGIYKGKPLDKDWYRLWIRYRNIKKDTKYMIDGLSTIPAEPFVRWGIVKEIDDVESLSDWLNTKEGKLFCGYVLQETYYI